MTKIRVQGTLHPSGGMTFGDLLLCSGWTSARTTRRDATMLEISDEKGSETHAFTILIYKVQNEPIVALVEGESASRITISASAVRSLGIRPPGDGEVRKFWVQWVRDAGKVVTLL